MDFNDYRKKLNWSEDGCQFSNENLTYAALGLSGEAGEVTDYIKKVVFHKHDMSKEKIAEELGDVLWYITYTAALIGYSLEDIAKMNIEKVHRRYPEGWDTEKSRNREK